MTLLQEITVLSKAYMKGDISIELYSMLVDMAIQSYLQFDRS